MRAVSNESFGGTRLHPKDADKRPSSPLPLSTASPARVVAAEREGTLALSRDLARFHLLASSLSEAKLPQRGSLLFLHVSPMESSPRGASPARSPVRKARESEESRTPPLAEPARRGGEPEGEACDRGGKRVSGRAYDGSRDRAAQTRAEPFKVDASPEQAALIRAHQKLREEALLGETRERGVARGMTDVAASLLERGRNIEKQSPDPTYQYVCNLLLPQSRVPQEAGRHAVAPSVASQTQFANLAQSPPPPSPPLSSSSLGSGVAPFGASSGEQGDFEWRAQSDLSLPPALALSQPPAVHGLPPPSSAASVGSYAPPKPYAPSAQAPERTFFSPSPSVLGRAAAPSLGTPPVAGAEPLGSLASTTTGSSAYAPASTLKGDPLRAPVFRSFAAGPLQAPPPPAQQRLLACPTPFSASPSSPSSGSIMPCPAPTAGVVAHAPTEAQVRACVSELGEKPAVNEFEASARPEARAGAGTPPLASPQLLGGTVLAPGRARRARQGGRKKRTWGGKWGEQFQAFYGSSSDEEGGGAGSEAEEEEAINPGDGGACGAAQVGSVSPAAEFQQGPRAEANPSQGALWFPFSGQKSTAAAPEVQVSVHPQVSLVAGRYPAATPFASAPNWGMPPSPSAAPVYDTRKYAPSTIPGRGFVVCDGRVYVPGSDASPDSRPAALPAPSLSSSPRYAEAPPPPSSGAVLPPKCLISPSRLPVHCVPSAASMYSPAHAGAYYGARGGAVLRPAWRSRAPQRASPEPTELIVRQLPPYSPRTPSRPRRRKPRRGRRAAQKAGGADLARQVNASAAGAGSAVVGAIGGFMGGVVDHIRERNGLSSSSGLSSAASSRVPSEERSASPGAGMVPSVANNGGLVVAPAPGSRALLPGGSSANQSVGAPEQGAAANAAFAASPALASNAYASSIYAAGNGIGFPPAPSVATPLPSSAASSLGLPALHQGVAASPVSLAGASEASAHASLARPPEPATPAAPSPSVPAPSEAEQAEPLTAEEQGRLLGNKTASVVLENLSLTARSLLHVASAAPGLAASVALAAVNVVNSVKRGIEGLDEGDEPWGTPEAAAGGWKAEGSGQSSKAESVAGKEGTKKKSKGTVLQSCVSAECVGSGPASPAQTVNEETATSSPPVSPSLKPRSSCGLARQFRLLAQETCQPHSPQARSLSAKRLGGTSLSIAALPPLPPPAASSRPLSPSQTLADSQELDAAFYEWFSFAFLWERTLLEDCCVEDAQRLKKVFDRFALPVANASAPHVSAPGVALNVSMPEPSSAPGLSRAGFERLLSAYPSCLPVEHHDFFFRTFARKRDDEILLRDFRAGFYVTQPEVAEDLEMASGKLRMQFIFRAYDLDADGWLSAEELQGLLKHLHAAGLHEEDQKVKQDADALDELVKKEAQVLLTRFPRFGYSAFLHCVRTGVFNATHRLLRCQVSLPMLIKEEEEIKRGIYHAASHKHSLALPTGPGDRAADASAELPPGAQDAATAAVAAAAAVVSAAAASAVLAGKSISQPPANQVGPLVALAPVGGTTPQGPEKAPDAGVSLTLTGRASPFASAAEAQPGGRGEGNLAASGLKQPETAFTPMTGLPSPFQSTAGLQPSAGDRLFASACGVGPSVPGKSIRPVTTPEKQVAKKASYPSLSPHVSAIACRVVQHAKAALPFSSRQELDARLAAFLAADAASPLGAPGVASFLGMPLALEDMVALFDACSVLFAAEETVIEVNLPSKIFGDIHGHLADLLEFFGSFGWPGDIDKITQQMEDFLFLGDYVDRGHCSLDVLLLLFSLKVLYPNRVFLLRGNHEDRQMNRDYGFFEELQRKLGEASEMLWEKSNDVFDLLPLAAFVPTAGLFCLHGCLGDSIESINDLRSIERPLHVSALNLGQSLSARDLENVAANRVMDCLWSDPERPAERGEDAVGPASPRGGHVVRSSAAFIESFLDRNRLALLVRGHECVAPGYCYDLGGRCLTLFSASNYCETAQNDGAALHVYREEEEEPGALGKPRQHITWHVLLVECMPRRARGGPSAAGAAGDDRVEFSSLAPGCASPVFCPSSPHPPTHPPLVPRAASPDAQAQGACYEELARLASEAARSPMNGGSPAFPSSPVGGALHSPMHASSPHAPPGARLPLNPGTSSSPFLHPYAASGTVLRPCSPSQAPSSMPPLSMAACAAGLSTPRIVTTSHRPAGTGLEPNGYGGGADLVSPGPHIEIPSEVLRSHPCSPASSPHAAANAGPLLSPSGIAHPQCVSAPSSPASFAFHTALHTSSPAPAAQHSLPGARGALLPPLSPGYMAESERVQRTAERAQACATSSLGLSAAPLDTNIPPGSVKSIFPSPSVYHQTAGKLAARPPRPPVARGLRRLQRLPWKTVSVAQHTPQAGGGGDAADGRSAKADLGGGIPTFSALPRVSDDEGASGDSCPFATHAGGPGFAGAAGRRDPGGPVLGPFSPVAGSRTGSPPLGFADACRGARQLEADFREPQRRPECSPRSPHWRAVHGLLASTCSPEYNTLPEAGPTPGPDADTSSRRESPVRVRLPPLCAADTDRPSTSLPPELRPQSRPPAGCPASPGFADYSSPRQLGPRDGEKGLLSPARGDSTSPAARGCRPLSALASPTAVGRGRGEGRDEEPRDDERRDRRPRQRSSISSFFSARGDETEVGASASPWSFEDACGGRREQRQTRARRALTTCETRDRRADDEDEDPVAAAFAAAALEGQKTRRRRRRKSFAV
ncbi:hypothetical protein BESB_052670 [Besnoitia besnoiti]|uniref:Serine/threonine-protein phosphatase n=1 Tax=Besnoitia besnoiti TaxID=94643 RepID=A0A2A9MI34_BESBE|nr:hypothetical protein BESB_052670 [Besnoitia besnoiti]PFH35616.1 hypothetical protein BESB_052670 [Besnoitia besnoiti]